MAAELVNAATSDKLTEIDWTKNIEICELVVRDNRQAKDVIKALKKRLGSKNSNTQLFAVSLLEMLMNNIGDPVHKQVIDTGMIPVLVKIVKKKSDLPVQEKIFLLLDAAQTSLGGASGRFPQYYSAYYDLVSAGVQFPQRAVQPLSNEIQRSSPDKELAPQIKGNATEAEAVKVPESSILQKAGTTLEVLREVLDAVDTRHPEAAKDEFTLDLVEQCSYQKQRVTQLAMTSRDDKVVSQAIELNEHLERVLARHDALVSSRPTSASNLLNHEQEEDEEEAEQLFRRLRKGKARAGPEDENRPIDKPLRLLGSNVPSEMLHRSLIRPLTVGPRQEQIDNKPVPVEPKQEQFVYRPVPVESKQEQGVNKLVLVEPKQEQNVNRPVVTLPPPPAKHAERERFFQENKSDGSTLSGRMKGLSLHSRNASSSRSGSVDFSEEAFS